MTGACPALYNFDRLPLPELPANSAPQLKSRRWSIIAAGLLLLALALVVIYTSRAAFSSPVAMVVVGAIGFAALLLQLRLRRGQAASVHAPLWLNIAALAFAAIAVSADVMHLRPAWLLVAALGAIICFAISGFVLLRGLRKPH